MLPPLYKFRSVDDYTLDSLEKGYVYFSNPTTFNDPFEMGVFLDQTSDLDAVHAEFMNTDWSGSPIWKEISHMTEEERTTFIEDYWACDEKREQYISDLASVRGFDEEWKKRMSIFCASASRENVLLWSHYASSHTGIAIELNANADTVLQKAQDVTYSMTFPVIDMYHDDDKTKFRKGMLTKSPDWAYENEYRALYSDPCENVKLKVDASVFVSITFGAKILDEDRDEVIKASRTRLDHVRFDQAKLSEKTFSLEFESFEVD